SSDLERRKKLLPAVEYWVRRMSGSARVRLPQFATNWPDCWIGLLSEIGRSRSCRSMPTSRTCCWMSSTVARLAGELEYQVSSTDSGAPSFTRIPSGPGSQPAASSTACARAGSCASSADWSAYPGVVEASALVAGLVCDV